MQDLYITPITQFLFDYNNSGLILVTTITTALLHSNGPPYTAKSHHWTTYKIPVSGLQSVSDPEMLKEEELHVHKSKVHVEFLPHMSGSALQSIDHNMHHLNSLAIYGLF